MKISPVLPIAFSSLLTASLAAPLRLRYPSTAEAEKRADTFLQPKGQSLDKLIHEKLDFNSGEALPVRDTELEKRAIVTVGETEDKETESASGATYSAGGSDQTLKPHGSFDNAINALLDFGGNSKDPVLFKKDAQAAPVVEKRAVDDTDSWSQKIHNYIDFGGSRNPVLFKKDAAAVQEKRDLGLPSSSSDRFDGKSFDAAIHDVMDFGGKSDSVTGGSSSLFVRAEKAVEGAAEKVARAFSA